VAVPANAEYETGFYRWVERLARIAEQLGCRIEFNATDQAAHLISGYMRKFHENVRDEYSLMETWDDFLLMRGKVKPDSLFVLISSRAKFVSYQNGFEQLPRLLAENFKDVSLMVIFPDQSGQNIDVPSFVEPNTSNLMPQSWLSKWLSKWISKIG